MLKRNVSKLLKGAPKFSCMSNHYFDQILPTKPCITLSKAQYSRYFNKVI